ncbi:hypothetical protein [Aquitalea sp.]|uniref:hypothetical protein n=1 Tax=Aquitalea sp. TaxID=1872623 RepID=UPI00258CE195|nr:hypothetical protein [Aquitalea sp.]
MKTHSSFFFTGATVLTLFGLLSGHWLMLPIAFLIAFCGMVVADREQLADMDARTAAMLLVLPSQHPLLPLDHFHGDELMFYQAGSPVYRVLQANGASWELVGEYGKVEDDSGCIRVYPGYLYRRRSTSVRQG